jgi:hypothetical protein
MRQWVPIRNREGFTSSVVWRFQKSWRRAVAPHLSTGRWGIYIRTLLYFNVQY